MTMNAKELESAAVAAHHRGELWNDWWARHGSYVNAAEPHDRRRYRRLYLRLFGLVVSGDLDGDRAMGDPEPWVTDDDANQQGEPAVSDTKTQACFQGTLFDTSTPYA
jgi:hypothetical protein